MDKKTGWSIADPALQNSQILCHIYAEDFYLY